MTRVGLPESISAALFDLDGVLTDTAAVHRRAWKTVFDRLLACRCGARFRPFTADDYLNYVDGRTRADGVREFLTSRAIVLPDGAPDDPPGLATVHGIGNSKNRLLLSLIERDGVRVYPGSVAYLTAVRAAGLRIAVVTSSANAAAVLDSADLTRFVDARIDGVEIRRRGLRGKPAPDSFRAAAEELGETPSRAAVYEDATAGVTAARTGGFGFVVGVDRVRDGKHGEALRRAGADVVVADLSELAPAQAVATGDEGGR
ncbi:beta-phosphoglucomutase family hydrolase [Nocardia blacklockiae]|uniref:beta-phosphoglucomutase family hydrolase n=1 Tax=Nocardia blacklockiae TaxID=480036 RepID=UPI0018957639|nr:beta-phosphoglucomutase family hydrolase [Nocardia blacklockiae]MBF6171331.1 beta-phosphoglucomutase family hydrolase [Nocardia blacklockiae]